MRESEFSKSVTGKLRVLSSKSGGGTGSSGDVGNESVSLPASFEVPEGQERTGDVGTCPNRGEGLVVVKIALAGTSLKCWHRLNVLFSLLSLQGTGQSSALRGSRAYQMKINAERQGGAGNTGDETLLCSSDWTLASHLFNSPPPTKSTSIGIQYSVCLSIFLQSVNPNLTYKAMLL